jgi:hypothetical protein
MTDFEKMAVCAIRYTIGRRSYVVADGHQWAMEWGAKSNWVRDVIIRDLKEATERCDSGAKALGDPTDEDGWRWVLSVLQAMKEPGR